MEYLEGSDLAALDRSCSRTEKKSSADCPRPLPPRFSCAQPDPVDRQPILPAGRLRRLRRNLQALAAAAGGSVPIVFFCGQRRWAYRVVGRSCGHRDRGYRVMGRALRAGENGLEGDLFGAAGRRIWLWEDAGGAAPSSGGLCRERPVAAGRGTALCDDVNKTPLFLVDVDIHRLQPSRMRDAEAKGACVYGGSPTRRVAFSGRSISLMSYASFGARVLTKLSQRARSSL